MNLRTQIHGSIGFLVVSMVFILLISPAILAKPKDIQLRGHGEALILGVTVKSTLGLSLNVTPDSNNENIVIGEGQGILRFYGNDTDRELARFKLQNIQWTYDSGNTPHKLSLIGEAMVGNAIWDLTMDFDQTAAKGDKIMLEGGGSLTKNDYTINLYMSSYINDRIRELNK